MTSAVIRDAINAEVERGGQVYFLHNRVGDMEQVKAKLIGICVPRRKIVIGHGQMDEGLLEVVMHQLRERRGGRAALHHDHRKRRRCARTPTPSSSTARTGSASADLYQLARTASAAVGERAHAYLCFRAISPAVATRASG